MNRLSRRQAIAIGALAGVAGTTPATTKAAGDTHPDPKPSVMIGQVRRVNFEPATGKERTKRVRITVSGRPQSAVAFFTGFDIADSTDADVPINALAIALGPCRCEGDQVEVQVRFAVRGHRKSNAKYHGWADVACIAW